MTKPLSVWKYYRANRRKVNVVFTITFISIILQYALLVYITSSVNLGTENQALGLVKAVSLVALVNPTREKQNSVIKLLQQHPAVAQVVPCEDSAIPMSYVGGLMLFLKHPGITPLMQTLKLNLIQGRLPKPGTREVLLHWRIAAHKGLKIGDCFTEKSSEDGPSNYQLSGLLDGKLIMGFADLDRYLQEKQEREEKMTLLIVPQPDQLAQVNQYVKRLVQNNKLVSVSGIMEELFVNSYNDLLRMTNIIHLVITGIIAICASFLFYLYFYQRQTEFGLLEAMGHTRPQMIGRAFVEILMLNLLGLGGALGISILCGWGLNHFFLHVRGGDLVLWEPGYLFKLLSTPVLVTFCSLAPVWRLLKRVDPILIIERAGGNAKVERVKPLSNWQYFRNNHRPAGAVLMVVLLSSFLQGGLLSYTTSMLRLEQRCELEPWAQITYTGYVKPTPVKLGHLRQSLGKHPAIAKVLPYLRSTNEIHGVGITTFPILYLDAHEIPSTLGGLNLKLVKGRFPTASSYEVVMHWQLAANWGIKVGDQVQKSKYRLVGIVEGKPLLGLANLEQLVRVQHLAKDNLNLLVIPKRGQLRQAKLYLSQLRQADPELITSASSEQTSYEDAAEFELIINLIYATITGLVCLCVGFLYYLYFWQRRPELGMLEAIGHTRKMLIGRALMEMLGMNLCAFGWGVTLALLGGWALNRLVLIQHGLPLVLWDPSYPGKLLPLPLLVTFGSLTPVWRMMTQVNPIAMIEGEV